MSGTGGTLSYRFGSPFEHLAPPRSLDRAREVAALVLHETTTSEPVDGMSDDEVVI